MAMRFPLFITVESTRPFAICSRCGQKTFEFHIYDDPIRLRHLPILEQRVFIEMRPNRFLEAYQDGRIKTSEDVLIHIDSGRAQDLTVALQVIGQSVGQVAV
jgi:hypothetical protein